MHRPVYSENQRVSALRFGDVRVMALGLQAPRALATLRVLSLRGCGLGLNAGAMRRCADEDTGKNSVSPWMIPRSAANHRATSRYPTRA